MSGPVIDLAYGRVTGPGGTVDLTTLLEDIDCAERRALARQALREVMRRAAGASRILLPTVWGPVRTEALVGELASVGAAAEPVPRAVAIAASHADATVHRCAVVETRMLPATGGHWSVHTVTRTDGRWSLGRGAVDLPRRISAEPGWSAPLRAADAVFVDGPDPESVAAAQRLLLEAFGVRAMAVDRTVLTRHGGRLGPVSAAELLAGLPAPPIAASRRGLRAPAVVAAVLVLAAAATAGWAHWPRPERSAQQTVRVGRAELAVPGQWRRSDGDDATAGSRTVFAAPDDGRRLIVVVSRLRGGSTVATVAESLRNRIAQRGDDAVAEFAADVSYAGRRVIGYRETPASGSPVAWYVAVESGTQISIGCQTGTGEESVDGPCRGAVGSLRVVSD
ncbi:MULTISPECIES: type VII secretion-associated protein [Gordonia]|uniref:Type VII secretion-associated protein n=2 Tax=Gordonia sihwensis TaxID=173559 RepID=L7LKT1_9ACTN|nr:MULTISPECIES: type VII secretion-associated protein [Gordonia]MBY4570253.1 type VII secretion-associated protein [Gordonia sihwensis]GAC61755.1 hypothetical protein GSI01S_21_00030 [Gordonia sihwensis NBRC 108236]